METESLSPSFLSCILYSTENRLCIYISILPPKWCLILNFWRKLPQPEGVRGAVLVILAAKPLCIGH